MYPLPYSSRKQHRGLDESLATCHTTRMNFPIHRTTILIFLVVGSALLSTACVEQTEPACPVSGCEEQEDGTVVTIGDPSESEDTSMIRRTHRAPTASMIHRVHLIPVLQMNHRMIKTPAKSIQARPLKTVRRR